MALSVGSCSSYDVVSILRKARQDISGCEASIKAQRVDAVPAVFESIHLHFTVTGKALSDKQVERAVSLSADKYCSASIMLRDAGVKITHSYEVLEG
jgi:putative redox protein